jgi:predicted  nucleic acid-binding Zn-ribbon protein
LHRRLDIAKQDAADAESHLGMAMDTLHKLTKEKDEWKSTQLQVTTDLEKLSHDNRRFREMEGQRDTEVQVGTTCNMAVFKCDLLHKGQVEKEHEIARLRAELNGEKKAC